MPRNYYVQCAIRFVLPFLPLTIRGGTAQRHTIAHIASSIPLDGYENWDSEFGTSGVDGEKEAEKRIEAIGNPPNPSANP